ncbi:MAG: hypothetical protein WDN76_04965 [Alphaproteobacteria bacterium]
MTVSNDAALTCHLDVQEQCNASATTASESCSFSKADSKLYIESKVESSSSQTYAPDNFELKYDGAGFTGMLASSIDAPVTFTRQTN